jgi:hypothetical protein
LITNNQTKCCDSKQTCEFFRNLFRRFSLRGKENVSREWKLVCAVSNLLKLFWAGWVLEMA